MGYVEKTVIPYRNCCTVQRKWHQNSIFVDTNRSIIENAALISHRTEELLLNLLHITSNLNPELAVQPFKNAALIARDSGLGLKCGS